MRKLLFIFNILFGTLYSQSTYEMGLYANRSFNAYLGNAPSADPFISHGYSLGIRGARNMKKFSLLAAALYTRMQLGIITQGTSPPSSAPEILQTDCFELQTSVAWRS